MDIQSLKIDLIHWLTELRDETVLEKIQAIKEEGDYDLSPAQQEELDKRLERYERGDMKFKSWEETKASIRSRSKNAK
jgi:putative addiction module component (TIGR02574 family)